MSRLLSVMTTFAIVALLAVPSAHAESSKAEKDATTAVIDAYDALIMATGGAWCFNAQVCDATDLEKSRKAAVRLRKGLKNLRTALSADAISSTTDAPRKTVKRMMGTMGKLKGLPAEATDEEIRALVTKLHNQARALTVEMEKAFPGPTWKPAEDAFPGPTW